MFMDERQHAKDQLAALVEDFRQATARGDLQGQSEATARTWVEGTHHRRPDYCLLANGRRTLCIDAKNFAADIKNDASIAYQVRCYGWSEGFRLS